MPRKKGPAHFKVLVNLANHPKTAELAGDNDLLATWTRLGLLAVDRWAQDSDDSFLVHDRELCSITGKGRADVARRSLRRLADVSPIKAEPEGDLWRITFPNFAKRQRFRGANVPLKEPSSSSPSTATSERENLSLPGCSTGNPEGVIPKPSGQWPDEVFDACREWVIGNGWAAPTLNAGIQKFEAWIPLQHPRRTPEAWVAAFQRIVEDSISEGKIDVPKAAVVEELCQCPGEPSEFENRANRCTTCSRSLRPRRTR